jgi:hypothetical protein
VSKNDGGSAFPMPDQYAPDGRPIMQGSNGMTLRDWFAGHVISGFCSDVGGTVINGPILWDQMAEEAYQAADAMLKAREQQ